MERIGVDPAGARIMAPKQLHYNLKVEGLTPAQANILKQDILSIGGEAAVARGVASCSVERTDAIVSGTMAHFLHNAGYTVVALSDSGSGVYNAEGIDPVRIEKYKRKTGSVTGEYCEGERCDIQRMKLDGVERVSNAELLELPCDILIPAALDNVITEKNADKIKAPYILEIANGPTTPEADAILEGKGVRVIPDILANSGGVTVSYFEWVQGRSGGLWTAERVDADLKRIMLDAYRTVRRETHRQKMSYRYAAFSVAVKRILEAMRARGWVEAGK